MSFIAEDSRSLDRSALLAKSWAESRYTLLWQCMHKPQPLMAHRAWWCLVLQNWSCLLYKWTDLASSTTGSFSACSSSGSGWASRRRVLACLAGSPSGSWVSSSWMLMTSHVGLEGTLAVGWFAWVGGLMFLDLPALLFLWLSSDCFGCTAAAGAGVIAARTFARASGSLRSWARTLEMSTESVGFSLLLVWGGALLGGALLVFPLSLEGAEVGFGGACSVRTTSCQTQFAQLQYVYTHTHVCMCTHIHTCMCIHTHNVHVCILYVHTCTYIHTYTHI